MKDPARLATFAREKLRLRGLVRPLLEGAPRPIAVMGAIPKDSSMKAHRILLSVLLGLVSFLLGAQRAEAAGTSLSSIPNACWTTEQPFTLVENDRAQLAWDVYGNLTLLNDGGSKSRVVWGLNSPVPLVGAAAGKLCFGNGAGRLRIHDAASNMVWVSGSYTAPNGTLSITQCTIQIADTNGVVQWQQGTPNCDTRSLTTPPLGTSFSSLPNSCWSTEQPFVVLENDVAALTWDEYGNLTLANVGGSGSKVSWGLDSATPLKGATAGMFCFGNGSGYLRIHDANGAVVWTSGTAYTAHNGVLSLDQCTMQIEDTGGVVRWQAATPSCDHTAKPAPTRSDDVLPASSTCWTTAQPFTLVQNDLAKLTWDQSGKLTLTNFAGGGKSVSWGADSSAASLCFDGAAGLRIVGGDGNQVWSAGVFAAQNAYLTLDACTAEIKDGNGVIHWRESTPQCDKRTIAQPASNTCWSGATAKRILWDEDHDVELWFSQNELLLAKDGSTRRIAAGRPGESGTLCYETDGSLVITPGIFGFGNIITRSSSLSGAAMSLDANGLSFTEGNVGQVYAEFDPERVIDLPFEYKRFDAGPRPPSVDAGWCRTAESPGTIVQSGNAHLDWVDGRLSLFIGTATTAVYHVNGHRGDVLCLEKDGRLSVYDRQAGVWNSVFTTGRGVDPDSKLQLTLDGCHIAIIATRTAQLCDRYRAHELKDCGSEACTNAEMSELFAAMLLCGSTGAAYTPWQETVPYCDPTVSGESFSFVKEMRSGNSDFGAELWVVGAALNVNGINALRAAVLGTGAQGTIDKDLPLGNGNPPSGYFQVLGDAGAGATLFGANFTVLDATGYVENLDGPKDHIAVTSLGATLYSLDTSGVADRSWSRTFFDMDQTYMLGCIPVTVHAGVTGTIGIHVNAYPNVATSQVVGFTGIMEPYASLDLDASVGVGVSGASAGIAGELNLVRLSFPFTLDITSFSNRTYKTSLDFSVHTLEGEVDLYAELGSLRAKKEIASFEGYATSANLFTQTGSL